MRLTLRLTVLLMLPIGALLLLNAVLRVQRERDVFENDMRRDHMLLATSVVAEALMEWQDHGEAGARAVVEKLNSQRAHVDIALRTLDELEPDLRDELRHGAVQRSEQGEAALRTFAPVMSRGSLVAAVRLKEALEPVREYVRTSMIRTLFSAALGLTLSALVALWFGAWLVGRPIEALVRRMRRIADGDLTSPLAIEGRAEISTLADEINAMCTRLADARTRAADEAERRVTAMQQLRHADRLSTIGMLAAGLAHELGTPLNIIGGRARMIEEHASDGRVQEDARAVARQTEKVTRIVRQLLDFARATPRDHHRLDVHRVVADALALLAPIARERGISLHLSSAPALALMVEADGGQLEQALLNVVLNAIQATPTAGHVHVHVRTEGERIAVEVKDEGPGIAPEHLDAVFLPFFTTKDVGEGTGLGLAVAYGIVQDHGGSLRVQSVVGAGTSFTFDLPASSAHGAA